VARTASSPRWSIFASMSATTLRAGSAADSVLAALQVREVMRNLYKLRRGRARAIWKALLPLNLGN
jgi:hypothetical protein